ncbi:MAG: hypothetical protein HQM14_22010, partial [SAR324 cluster bacterium]|nr:hypothetical protein [SAR324 cluster bacterium]
MSEIRDSFADLISPWLNLPRYPEALERIDLFFINIPTTIITLLFLTIACFTCGPFRTNWTKSTASLIILLPSVVRFLYDYAYDTPFSLISQIVDISICFIIFHSIGKKTHHSNSIFLNITIGIATITLVSLLALLLRINTIFNTPSSIISMIVPVWLIFTIWKSNSPLPKIKSKTLLITGLIIFPFLPYFFTPAPPDADITTMSEMLGYLFQGQNLFHVHSGIEGEWYSIRYPAGFPALGWSIAHLLNIRASESLLLLWFISFVVFVNNLMILAQKLKINKFLILLFTLNGIVIGWTSLRGGQVQEMLSYALGMGMISLFFNKRFNAGAFCLGASMVIHPVVSLPFCLVFFIWTSWHIVTKNIPISKFIIGLTTLTLIVIYLFLLTSGPTLTPSQPQIIL